VKIGKGTFLSLIKVSSLENSEVLSVFSRMKAFSIFFQVLHGESLAKKYSQEIQLVQL
jgi:hypothetical protein